MMIDEDILTGIVAEAVLRATENNEEAGKNEKDVFNVIFVAAVENNYQTLSTSQAVALIVKKFGLHPEEAAKRLGRSIAKIEDLGRLVHVVIPVIN